MNDELIAHTDWNDISRNKTLSEDFIEKYKDKVDWNEISFHQKLSERFIEKHADKVNWRYITYCQKLSKEFLRKNYYIVHNCGNENRSIMIYKDNPKIIYIGCFSGTKEEAIEAIRKRYCLHEEIMIDYIAKVEECFNFVHN